MISNLYALVDKESKTITTSFQQLPTNWRNISGLCFMSETDLNNLGWMKLTDRRILEYSHDPFIVESLKGELLSDVATLRWQAQTEAVTHNGNVFILNESTVNAIYQKRMIVANNLEATYNWKTRDGVVELSGNDIVNLTNAVHDYIQDCFDVEAEFVSRLSALTTLEQFLTFNYTLNWPSTQL